MSLTCESQRPRFAPGPAHADCTDTSYTGVVDPVTDADARLVHLASEAGPADAPVEAEELPLRFTAGRLCLDLVATIGERWRRRIERLRTPADLGRWAVEAGLADRPPRVTHADLEQARRVRGAVARVVLAWGRGEPLPAEDVAVVNAAASAPDVAPALDPDGSRASAGRSTVRAVLSAVARDAIDLVATGDPTRLRECAAEDCSLLFHDASRPGARRWCSMRACGNRHKTAEYRRRQTRTRKAPT